ncbi:T9SS type B sorting domain-containing protein [Flavobacterium sp. WG21]|uniref:Ig-like domain-containing protein n=1 Tax=Flavobacterium sp. WG21 TaxID=1229487 RepID=UPI000346AA4E|nr:T9SS type B sorting domain-containing protein [Flavobacterium sp. WG21]
MPLLIQKINFKFIFLLLFVLSQFNGRSQDFIWAANTYQKTYGYSDIRSIVTDSKGNTYATGGFGGTVDFDSGPNNLSLTALPRSQDYTNSFILKLDKDKKVLWVKQIHSIWADRGKSIILDKDENVIITGIATGSQIDLYPDSPGQHIINNITNSTGSFILKLDPEGNFIFGNFYLGAFADESTLDNENNIITTGSGTTTVDFNAGSGIYNLNSAGSMFLLKNDSNGNFIWAKRIGSSIHDYPISLVCDSQNNIIFKGNFNNNITFANTNYTTSTYGYNCNFICKLKPDGQESWFRQLGTIGGAISNEDKSVKVDPLNNIYFSSTSSGSFTTNFGNTSLFFNSNVTDSFLFKLNQNGEYLWHNSIYGEESQEVKSITFDNTNGIYLVASMNGKTFVNDDCNKIYPINKPFGSDGGMLLKFNTDGKFINFKNILTTGFSLQFDFQNNILIGGSFKDQPDFDPSPVSSHFLHTFYSDGFVLKLAPCTSNIPEADKDQYFCASLNPTINDLKPCAKFINWYDSKTATVPLERNLLLENGKTYYASYLENCSENERLSVTIHLNIPTLPIITNSTFCKKDNPKLSQISILGSNLKWYNSLLGGDLLPSTTLLKSNTTYYVSQQESTSKCESQRVAVTPILNGDIIIPNSPQTFCIQQNATLASIQIAGNNIKWYDAQTAGTLLSNTTLLQNGLTYYATQTINGCESERIPVTVNIQNTAAPTGDANQPFCTGQNPTIANIQTNGNAVKWYDSLHNGSLLVETTNLTDGKTYYASQTINGCESPRFGVTVSIVSTPSAPTGNANPQFCKSENATLKEIQIIGQNIKWYDTSFSAGALPNTTLLENKTYYASQTIGCESDRTPILVQVNDTALPTGNSNQQFCIDENATIANLAISGSAIKWYDAATNGSILPGTSLLQNRIYYASQTLNNCESEKLAITVKIQDTQKPIADSRQTFCFQQNASIKDINIVGQNIKWFENNVSTVTLLESTPLKNGMTYYASQTIANCESDRISVVINILEATNQNCIHLVEELPFPNFFTPNNDGYNDTWTIDFGYLAPNTVIQIFDRYGKFIKELTKDTYWDGTYLGKNEPTSDYWFTATRSNGKEYRGHFTLKR